VLPKRTPEARKREREGAVAAATPREQQIARALARIGAQLTLSSSLFRHALRLRLAVVVALLLVPFVDRANGAWMVTGALIVMKPAFGGTVKTARQRAAGTVIGAALAGALAALTSDPWVLLTVAFLATWLAESLITLSFTLFAVCITPLSILLANVLVPGNFEVAWQRTVDVAVGAAIGIVVSILVLPQPVKDTLPARLTAAIDAVGEFLDAVSAAFRDPVADTHPARAKAERALLDLNILVGQLGDEPSTWRQGAGPSADATRALRAVVDDAATMLIADDPPPAELTWRRRIAALRAAVKEQRPPALAVLAVDTAVDADLNRLSEALARLLEESTRPSSPVLSSA
jgi:uncharacterized membrane protein YccC